MHTTRWIAYTEGVNESNEDREERFWSHSFGVLSVIVEHSSERVFCVLIVTTQFGEFILTRGKEVSNDDGNLAIFTVDARVSFSLRQIHSALQLSNVVSNVLQRDDRCLLHEHEVGVEVGETRVVRLDSLNDEVKKSRLLVVRFRVAQLRSKNIASST